MKHFLFILPLLLLPLIQIHAQVKAPILTCIKGDSLIFSKPFNTCGNFIAFEVYGSQTRAGGYTLLGSITDETAFTFEHNTPGEELWYYYMQSNFDCPGISILTSDTLDNLPPAVSPLISVSVENGIILLNWQASPSIQTFAYIIYRLTDQGTIPIDTVGFGTSVPDIFANPTEQSEVYFVTAMDQCGNTSAFVEPHRSIFLQADTEPCNQAVRLNWNLYENWDDGIEAQEIWVSSNNGNFERIAVISGDQNNYIFQNAENGVNYRFYVNAIQRNTGVNAKSNTVQIEAAIINPVGNLLVKNVTFTEDNEIELLWEWNAQAALNSIEIFRSSDNISFQNVANPDPTPPLEDPTTYLVDPTHANEMKTFYRINTVDQCDTSTISNYVSTIFLEGMAQPNRENLLNWTPYDTKIGTVNTYAIYKLVDDAPLFLRRIPGNTTSYADPITTAADAGACYYIEAELSVTFAKSGIENYISKSNTTCLSQAASIVMPNAFAPRGNNQTFKPTILFGNSIQNYQLLIYNRYGGKIFESTDPNIGWNGQKNGKDVPMGTYTYLVRIAQANGDHIEEGGVLMLMR